MKDYIIYECEVCGLNFILPTDGLRKADVLSRHLACNLGHVPIREIGRFDSLRDCMEMVNTYKRESGRIKQTRYSK